MRFFVAFLVGPAIVLAAPAINAGSSTTTTVTRTSVVYTTATTYTTTTSTIGRVSTVTSTSTTTTFTPVSTSVVFSTTTVTRPCDGTKQQAVASKRNEEAGPVTLTEPEHISTQALNPRAAVETCTATVTVKSTSTATLTSQSSIFTTVATATSTAIVTTTQSLASTVTTTSIVTSTVEPTSCPAPTTCDNQGLQFAVFSNAGNINNDANYSSFRPETLKTKPNEYANTINYIGGFQYTYSTSPTWKIYNQYPRAADYWALNHKGYIYAPQNGRYNFTIDYPVDDIAEVWVGDLAYSGWTRNNALVHCPIEKAPCVASPSYDFVAGKYYAIRIVYANAQTDAGFGLTVRNPDGSVLLNKDSTGSPYLVRYSCDMTTAKKFADWGSET